MARWQPAERDARYRKRRRAGFPTAVSEGDSWFDYPFYLNLIDRLDDAGLFAHLRLEVSGDTAADMIGSAAARSNLRTVVEDARPMVVLFSAGGNDLGSAAGELFQPLSGGDDPAACIVESRLDALFADLRTWYTAMIEAIGPSAPIFAHGYDYFAPSARPVRISGVRIGAGPWILPAMIRAGIQEEATRRAIAALLVDRFNELLADLAACHPLDFVHADLRGTLDMDREWENEIHPNRKGFRKVADRFRAILVDRLPDLQRERVARELVVA
jgi:lysophospholipase L1-like esterase